MKIDSAKLKEILVKENYVSTEDMAKAEKYAKDNQSTIADYLFSQDILTKDLLGQAVAESFGVSYSDLNSNQPSQKQILKIPEASASKFRIVLFKEEEKGVVIATDNPKKKLLAEELKKIFKTKKVKITY
ncbi:hypothetical protein COB52_01100 [Candidatus Kaiserbacteria bacterium]|nr:MAG: hypothetical protein COB52_01100 [Candidatus Kaiserbacteria bacterium]